MISNGLAAHERLSPGARMLIDSLRLAGGAAAAMRVEEVPSLTWDEILAIAQQHAVAPLPHRALQADGALTELPEPVRARLEEERRATALDNLRNYGEFQRVSRVLREQNIPLMALKGLHLAELAYRDISLRPMIDVDLLVPLAQRRHAIAALRAPSARTLPTTMCSHSACARCATSPRSYERILRSTGTP